MTLDQRKQKILRAITDDYISTAEPVGSRSIARKYNLGISPATIRNEMADLEEEGYLEQPHTSAGRIPSDKGYRFYVDVLMEPAVLSPEETREVQEVLQAQGTAAMEMLHRVSHLLAEMTRYTAIVLGPTPERRIFKHVEFIRLDERTVLITVVTRPGMVQNRLVENETLQDPRLLLYLSTTLTQRLKGLTLGEVASAVLREVEELIPDPTLSRAFVEMLNPPFPHGEDNVYIEGMTNLLRQPEFRDVRKAQTFLSIFETREALASYLQQAQRQGGLTIYIGQENAKPEFQECSLVVATYSYGGHNVGTVGVFGPTRMDYAKAVTVVRFLADCLSEALEKISL